MVLKKTRLNRINVCFFLLTFWDKENEFFFVLTLCDGGSTLLSTYAILKIKSSSTKFIAFKMTFQVWS